MKTFKNNIIKTYKEEGRKWLASLPQQVEDFAKKWELESLKPLKNLTFNYILEGMFNSQRVILKLSPNEEALAHEANALEAFQRHGAVDLLKRESNAILLQRPLPGITLKKGPLPQNQKIEIACSIIQKLQDAPLPKGLPFPNIEEWLAVLDKDWDLPKEHLLRARTLKNKLLSNIRQKPLLLHGDLHQENILSEGENWVVIDPKGVVGYPINELWACVEDPSTDLLTLANTFHYPFQEVVSWYYVHLLLAASWQAEDRLDPSRFLNLADKVSLEMGAEGLGI